MKKSEQSSGTAAVAKDESRKKFWKRVWKQRWLFALSMPMVIWLFIFAFVPLLGWILAFFKYVPGKSFFSMDFVGLQYFKEAFSDSRFWNALRNTVAMSLLNVIFACTVCPILFALFLNELRGNHSKKLLQTVSYLPHFVSWVVVAGIFRNMMNSSGIVNDVLINLGIIKERFDLFSNPNYFYVVVTIATIWKELGWNAIIYISSMAGIDPEYYEAASVDGAGRFRKMWNITLPCIKPTIMILLIINIGGVLGGGLEKQQLFRNAINIERARVLDMYVLDYGISNLRFSFGTAVGIITSIASLILVYSANKLSKKFSGTSLT